MPATKRRSRHGTNTPSSSASSNLFKSHSLPSATVANGTNHLNHHLNHNIAFKSSASVLSTVNGAAARVAGDGVTGCGAVAVTAAATVSSTFTLKQQQQLDRNAYLLTLTKDQLKVECRKRGQKSTGTKAELVFMPSYNSYKCIYASILQTHNIDLLAFCWLNSFWFFFCLHNAHCATVALACVLAHL